jgi:hypothetical protein
MHVIVWEFLPRVGKEPEFERAYGSTGEWAKLFAQSADYRGTELLKSREGNTYLTFDRWTSVEALRNSNSGGTPNTRRWTSEWDL